MGRVRSGGAVPSQAAQHGCGQPLCLFAVAVTEQVGALDREQCAF
jgi:hypothetical protein